jgi:hypothetical protein
VLPLTSLVKGPGGVPLDDAVAAVRAIVSIRQLGLSVGISILSIAFFNFFGVSGELLSTCGAPGGQCGPGGGRGVLQGAVHCDC